MGDAQWKKLSYNFWLSSIIMLVYIATCRQNKATGHQFTVSFLSLYFIFSCPCPFSVIFLIEVGGSYCSLGYRRTSWDGLLDWVKFLYSVFVASSREIFCLKWILGLAMLIHFYMFPYKDRFRIGSNNLAIVPKINNSKHLATFHCFNVQTFSSPLFEVLP